MVVCKVIGFHPLGCIKDALQALTGQIIFVEMILVMDTPSINAGKINEGAGHVGRLPARPFDFVATSGRMRHWHVHNSISFERMLDPTDDAQLHQSDASTQCLARGLCDTIVKAVAVVPTT